MSNGWLWEDEDELPTAPVKPPATSKRRKRTDLDSDSSQRLTASKKKTPEAKITEEKITEEKSPGLTANEANAAEVKKRSASGSVGKPIAKPLAMVEELPVLALGQDPEQPLTVSQLNAWVKGTLDEHIPQVWLEAEVSDLSRPSSGHLYMTLKDKESQIRGVLWRSAAARLHFALEDGQSILCCGNLDVYGPRGTYQFIIQRAQPQGIGALQLAFQQLHAKLAKEGLFDADRKKPMPKFPCSIGFVTSPSGAAVHDFLQVLRRRWQGIHVLIIPTRVQGEGAAKEIAAAIAKAQTIRPALDVLVVGRGGGSLEDLWCFNEEPVLRALASCSIPTVSAVGHEIDVTLSDLVADLRALTPTEAAEMLLPDSQDLKRALQATRHRLDHLLLSQFGVYRKRLEMLSSRPALAQPMEWLHRKSQRLDELQLRLKQAGTRSLQMRHQQLERVVTTLEALNPLRVLQRGYSVTRDAETGQIVASLEALQVGQRLETQLADGVVTSRIETLKSKDQ